MNIDVTYMSGAGNIFTVVDNRSYRLDGNFYSNNSQIFCQSTVESGNQKTEGLIILNNSNDLDFDVVFFNPDGSVGPMCGNGGRCAVNFALVNNFVIGKSKVIFSMANQVYTSEIMTEGLVKLIMPPPFYSEFDKIINIGGFDYIFDLFDVNSDHIVFDYDNLVEFQYEDFRSCKFVEFARKFRYHNEFPRGVNVNIYQKIDESIHLRTYERGVEAETGACGTGSISAAISAINKYNLQMPLNIIPPSGQILQVNIIGEIPHSIENFELIGNSIDIGKKTIDV